MIFKCHHYENFPLQLNISNIPIICQFLERKTRGGTRKEPPARPPPITNNNNVNNSFSNKTIDDGQVTLRNPAGISEFNQFLHSTKT
jgi:hypothetical protein